MAAYKIGQRIAVFFLLDSKRADSGYVVFGTFAGVQRTRPLGFWAGKPGAYTKETIPARYKVRLKGTDSIDVAPSQVRSATFQNCGIDYDRED